MSSILQNVNNAISPVVGFTLDDLFSVQPFQSTISTVWFAIFVTFIATALLLTSIGLCYSCCECICSCCCRRKSPPTPRRRRNGNRIAQGHDNMAMQTSDEAQHWPRLGWSATWSNNTLGNWPNVAQHTRVFEEYSTLLFFLSNGQKRSRFSQRSVKTGIASWYYFCTTGLISFPWHWSNRKTVLTIYVLPVLLFTFTRFTFELLQKVRPFLQKYWFTYKARIHCQCHVVNRRIHALIRVVKVTARTCLYRKKHWLCNSRFPM